ncbi:MAG: methylated-DNA--[protein]-cysteine S-methyltransferase [bacterium]|nr:methylated-DNA--[protein]-cysteine S-methyltransferase [bacterium]
MLMNNSDNYTKDYYLIETAIKFIEVNKLRQPDLKEIADEVGLSEFHFQKLFKRWAGISPKRFLQFLTAEHARSLLAQSQTILDTAANVGLSGGGRLHDLTISMYAMTPGEIRALGTGLTIHYGYHPTPFGFSFIALTNRRICDFYFVNSPEEGPPLLRAEWPGAVLLRDQDKTGPVIQQIFSGSGKFTLHIKGSNFQVRVWEALLRIPSGALRTYGDLAKDIGSPNASRAVGNAVGSNPVSFLIPCHRVIRNSGVFGNYRWGPLRKKALHAWEAALNE